jgi:3-phenylpropionate/trans-cinnamate dioxygenase ferredoxin reductase component
MALERITIVGASLAGIRTAQGLRSKGFDGTITLIGDEERPPYDRPPLSKQILAGTRQPEQTVLVQADDLAALDLDLRLGQRATELDLDGREVGLTGGDRVSFDAVVVATGATPRELPGTPDLAGIHALRTLDDALAIRAHLEASPKVVVIGAGFIGAEVAATARGRGLDVTVLEVLPVPLGHALGTQMGLVCAGLHLDHGVELRCGVGVAGFEGSDRVERVVLSDGTHVEADLVVVGVGVRPASDWLAGSGLDVSDGVVCDATLQAVGAPFVYAAGDVARWDHRLYGEQVRIEHWTNANDQGRSVAANLLSGPDAAEPFAPVPYVWSDQYDRKIQVLGRCRADDTVEVVFGSTDDRRFLALYGRDGRLTGALGFSLPAKLMRFNALLERSAPWDEALAVARELT